MNTILPCAQALLYTLMGLMPSPYQILSLQAILTMFWEPQRIGLPEQCLIKSPAALSRFFNEYGWPTRAVIRATRKQVLKELLKYAPIGKRPHLQVIIDSRVLVLADTGFSSVEFMNGVEKLRDFQAIVFFQL